MQIRRTAPRLYSRKYRLHNIAQICQAIEDGDVDTLLTILEETQFPPNFWVWKDSTILHLATCDGNAAIVQRILDYGADPNLLNKRGYSALHLAAFYGHTEVARILIKYADPELRCRGHTALHTAASLGNAEVLSLLCEVGDVHAEGGSTGWTPLVFAMRNGHSECVEILARSGADVDVRCDNDDTQLMCAASVHDAIMVSTLLSLGANIDAIAKDGTTSAMCVAGYGNLEALAVLVLGGAVILNPALSLLS